MTMHSLARGAILLALLLAMLLVGGPAPAAESPLAIRQVAPGVFLHQGAHQETTEANLGAIANLGFIVGERCVAVIDTGGSLDNGRRLRLAIRQETSLPVCYVINTHVHPDHVFGNAAFRQDAPVFIGHEHLAAALLARGDHYRKSLARLIGEKAAAGSELIAPTRAVASEQSIDLGGRVLQLRAWPTAHTDTDLTVLDPRTGTLWLGDLLFERRVPSLDGSLKGWLAVMETLRGMPARLVIPGHGAPSTDWPGAMRSQERYLQALLRDVGQDVRNRKTLSQAVAGAGAGAGAIRSEASRWLLFDEYHRRNVTAAYTELEWDN
jgi:quinoprotein relay system zinc metallohydrolase 2